MTKTAATSETTFLAVHDPGPLTEGLTSRPGIQFGLAVFLKSGRRGIILICCILTRSVQRNQERKRLTER